MFKKISIIGVYFFTLTILLLQASCTQDSSVDSQASENDTQSQSVVNELGEGGTGSSTNNMTPKQFIEWVNEESVKLKMETDPAFWVYSTYINKDTENLVTIAGKKGLDFSSKLIEMARQYKGQEMDDETARAIDMIISDVTVPAPNDPALREELARLGAELEGMYGEGKYCKSIEGGTQKCYSLGDLEDIIGSSHDEAALLDAWQGWRTISRPMRDKYMRYMQLMNQGAQDMGYSDTAQLWQSRYEMSTTDFTAQIDKLWTQVEPLYKDLHCYVRAKLSEQYGEEVVAKNEPIPAHLLGNMWAQTWSNVYDLVKPYPEQQQVDLTKALQDSGMDEVAMTKRAESFFTSLGLPSLPEAFWKNSLLKKPQDREVVCHASAWDMYDGGDDVRIKQCVKIAQEDFSTLHHELGHIYYYLMYKDLPILYRGGAHDGFHEAIGDTITLSMTPQYYKTIGLTEDVVSNDKIILNQQMQLALDKIAFLPFGKMIDEWRWQLFSGEIKPENANQGWWQLREKYQGLKAPIARTEQDFDPGAKYHIPGNTPYIRYFMSFVMQFQFHQALCEAAGFTGPLHECSIYKNKAAGKKMADMLSVGSSKPWRETFKKMTGQENMDAAAIVSYFKPLSKWLKQENQNKQCGW